MTPRRSMRMCPKTLSGLHDWGEEATRKLKKRIDGKGREQPFVETYKVCQKCGTEMPLDSYPDPHPDD